MTTKLAASLSWCAATMLIATHAFLPSSNRSIRRPYGAASTTSSFPSPSLALALPPPPPPPQATTTTRLRMSFMADSSDYKADKSDFGDAVDDDADGSSSAPLRGGEVDMADVPVVEEIPVPTSKNNVGNRFVAIVYDMDFNNDDDDDDDETKIHGKEGRTTTTTKDVWEMHRDRIALTERHVMWARKQNLYNETFNADSRADVLWSHQLLSSDMQRAVGHAMCIDSPTIEDCRNALSNDPIVRSLIGVDPISGTCDVSAVPLYRWRQIRDHTLRRDDGRDGLPNMVLAFDRDEAISDGLRDEVWEDHLEYLIRSERVIAAGPLHVATADKSDVNSIAMGTLLFFNAVDRTDAINFVESDPAASAGLYDAITVHRFNSLDVTGKFVSENLYFPGQNTYQMKEAMEYWGYPVDDLQTKWLNW